jgi:hypothetical protein
MNHYQKLISEATNRTDPYELELIEECMRNDVFHSTLDWQTPEQFAKGAREAVEVLKALGDLT